MELVSCQVVIFLTHFLLIYQKHYLKKGKLPKDARLIGQKETRTVYQEGEKIPPAAPPKNSLEDGKVFYGHINSMTLGLMNTDWAKAKTPETLEEHISDAAAAAANSTDVTPQGPVVDSPDSPNVSSKSLSLVDSPDSPDYQDVSSRSLSPVDSPDSPNFPPQSPASSSSRGEKRRDHYSSPQPNSSRDATAKN
jgi:hypothetical protein